MTTATAYAPYVRMSDFKHGQFFDYAFAETGALDIRFEDGVVQHIALKTYFNLLQRIEDEKTDNPEEERDRQLDLAFLRENVRVLRSIILKNTPLADG